MASSGRSLAVFIAALAVTAPALAGSDPTLRLAQSYGSEDMPGGVEARPSVPDASRSMGAPPPAPSAMPDTYDAAKPPAAENAPVIVDEPAPSDDGDEGKKKDADD